MKAHISIDDVILSLRELTEKCPESIFCHPFFRTLRYWHKQYGCVFSLYLFAEKDGFAIEDMTGRYRREWQANADWMRFGFHGKNADDTTELLHGFDRVSLAMTYFAGQSVPCATLRLHGFRVAQDDLDALKERGVVCLLCADDDRVSYDLPRETIRSLAGGKTIDRDGIRYCRTDLRIEKVSLGCILRMDFKRMLLVVFTHEWCFYSYRKLLTCMKMQLLLIRLMRSKPDFVFDFGNE